MIFKNKKLLTAFIIVFIDLMGFGLIIPLLPFIAEKLSANAFMVGLITSTYSLFQLIGSPILGKLSDRYGRKKLLLISQIGTFIGFLLLGFSNSLILIFISRAIDGLTGGNISIVQAYISDVTKKEERTKAMGAIGAAFGLGFIFGPAMGAYLSTFGNSVPAFFAAFMSLMSIFATFLFLKESVNLKKAKTDIHTQLNIEEIKIMFSLPNVLGYMTIFFVVSTAFSLFTGIFALWSEYRFHMGPKENGYVFTFIGVMSIVNQGLLLPTFLKYYKEKYLLSLSLIFLSLGLLSFNFISFPIFLIFPLIVISLGNGLLNPIIQSLITQTVESDEIGGLLGVFQSVGAVGRIAGPVLGGIIFDIMGPSFGFTISSLLILTLLLHQLFKSTFGKAIKF